MRLKLRNIGNSVGVIFPLYWLKKYNLIVGDELIVNDEETSIVLTPQRHKVKYSLKDLVAQSTTDNLSSEDLAWLNMDDVGEEKIW